MCNTAQRRSTEELLSEKQVDILVASCSSSILGLVIIARAMTNAQHSLGQRRLLELQVDTLSPSFKFKHSILGLADLTSAVQC